MGHPFVDAVELFRQSTRAYDAGALELAALGCRAALESACLVFLTTERVTEGGWTSHSLRKLDGSLRRVTFTEIIDAVRAHDVLSERQLAALGKIKDHGDFVAHLSAALTQQMDTFVREVPAKLAASPEHPPEFEKGLAPVEIEGDLNAGAAILLTLGSALSSGGR
jgi:hypothetical protein